MMRPHVGRLVGPSLRADKAFKLDSGPMPK